MSNETKKEEGFAKQQEKKKDKIKRLQTLR